MDSLNAVNLVGWLEADLSTAFQGQGTQVTRFTVCLEEQGAEKVHRVFVPVECWGKTPSVRPSSPRGLDRRPGQIGLPPW